MQISNSITRLHEYTCRSIIPFRLTIFAYVAGHATHFVGLSGIDPNDRLKVSDACFHTSANYGIIDKIRKVTIDENDRQQTK